MPEMGKAGTTKRPEVLLKKTVAGLNGVTIAVAESCTGGLLSDTITNVPGSSRYFTGGVIAYSNEVKVRLLGVRTGTLKTHGAVSGEVASEMASGVSRKLRSTIGVSVTGIAGPGGGSPEKPVGTVFICVASRGGEKMSVKRHLFKGTRRSIKKQSVTEALKSLLEVISGECKIRAGVGR